MRIVVFSIILMLMFFACFQNSREFAPRENNVTNTYVEIINIIEKVPKINYWSLQCFYYENKKEYRASIFTKESDKDVSYIFTANTLSEIIYKINTLTK
jgi:hypothetical protein